LCGWVATDDNTTASYLHLIRGLLEDYKEEVLEQKLSEMAKSAYLEVGMPSMRYVSNRRSDVKVGEDHPGNNDLRVRCRHHQSTVHMETSSMTGYS
jgi:hypothetical protein